MNLRQLILLKIAEECSEISQVCSKAIQFGLDSNNPITGINNLTALQCELTDLQACLRMLHMDLQSEGGGLVSIANEHSVDDKIRKVVRYAKYQIKCDNLILSDTQIPTWLRPYWETSDG